MEVATEKVSKAKDFSKVASDEVVERTLNSLAQNGFEAEAVDSLEDAKTAALKLIPQGAEVFTMTSETLNAAGIPGVINDSGKYKSVRNKLSKLQGQEDKKAEQRKLGAAPDYAIGSAHAITEDGHVYIASNTGSQLAAYVYGAGQVIWVVGAQKIVKDGDEALKRLYSYTLPLESKRLHAQYGVDSFISKLLIVKREIQPGRIHIIFVKQNVGF